MKWESDDSSTYGELPGNISPRSPFGGHLDQLSGSQRKADPHQPRRLTSVFVVNPSELAQLGWYHALYHVSDLLLVGTSGSAADAVTAISDGWADLVLIDADTDEESGLWVEQELLNQPVEAHYLFTSDRDDQRSLHDRTRRGATPFMRTNGGMDEMVSDLRSVVDKVFDNNVAWLQRQGLTLGSYPDPSLIEARARGTRQ